MSIESQEGTYTKNNIEIPLIVPFDDEILTKSAYYTYRR